MASEQQPISAIITMGLVDLPKYLNDLLEDINSKDKPFTINYFHFIIGSFTYPTDYNSAPAEFKRNHEFPQIVKNNFYQPELQFSPSMLEFISHIYTPDNTININQIVVLIDPSYKQYPRPYGICTELPDLDSQPIVFHSSSIDINPLKKIKFNSRLEPVIIADNIHEIGVSKLESIILEYRNSKFPNLINIMDCSSNTIRNKWVSNENPFVYIGMPECLLIDSDIQYIPMITFDNDTKSIRWCNDYLDEKILNELATVIDVCPVSARTYRFITTQLKYRIIANYLLPIYKLYGRLRVSCAYTMPDGSKYMFSDMTYNQFKYRWESSKFFQNSFLSYFDSYFKSNMIYFINKFTSLSNSENTYITDSIGDMLIKMLLINLEKLNQIIPDETCKIPSPHFISHGELEMRQLMDSISQYISAHKIHM